MSTQLFIPFHRRQDLVVDLDQEVAAMTNEDLQGLVRDARVDPQSRMGRVPAAAPVVYIIVGVGGIILYGGKEVLDKLEKESKDEKEIKESKDPKDLKDILDTKNKKVQKKSNMADEPTAFAQLLTKLSLT